MAKIQTEALPDDALLQKYKQQGAYTDCYCMDVPITVSLSTYVEAFYTSRLFKIERSVLAALARKPASDADARQLAHGLSTKFSAWTVEARVKDQLLLCDFLGATRSWLMVSEHDSKTTRLYFGSAVVPKSKSAFGEASFGFAFHALFGFHRLYTRALMKAACHRLHASATR